MKTCDIRIRDPYVLTDTDAGRYYLYGTTDETPGVGRDRDFQHMLVQIWLIGRALSLCLPLLWTFGPTASFGRRKFIVMRGVITCWPVLRRKTGGEVCRFCGQNHLWGRLFPFRMAPLHRPSGSLWMERCIWTARAGRGSYSAMNGRSLGMGQFAACGWKRTSAPQQKRQLRCFTRPKADGALRIRGRLSERQGKIM